MHMIKGGPEKEMSEQRTAIVKPLPEFATWVLVGRI